MSWESVAEDVAIQIISMDPCNADAGMVNFCRVALIGISQLPECPEKYLEQAQRLQEDYVRLAANPGEYVEWNDVAIKTHNLLAELSGCGAYATIYYS